MNKNIFNLETAIATWKHFLKHRKSFFKDDIEELELHLREHTAYLVQSGLTEEDAFRKAASNLGSISFLEDEFSSVYWPKIKHKQQLIPTILFQLSMFKNYIKLTFRNLGRSKGFSSLNISGLAMGLTCAFLVFLWMESELSVDAFHEHQDRLYQVKVNDFADLLATTWSNAPAPLAAKLESNVPEIESAILTLPIRVSLRNDEIADREIGFFASPSFFEAFTFPMVEGEPHLALDSPNKIAISESLALKYFGDKWEEERSAVGKSITLDYWQSNGGVLGNAVRVDEKKQYIVSGVFEDVPSNSSLAFDFVLPVEDILGQFSHLSDWGPRWFELYVLLNENAQVSQIQQKIEHLVAENAAGAENQLLMLQPFSETYLHGSFENGRASGGLIQRVYLIGLVGLAILLIACINFTNLITARSSLRAREIGVRKAMGATPSSLIQQFLGEAIITSLIAFVLAIFLMMAVLSPFGTVTGLDLDVSRLTLSNWISFLSISLVTGLIAGAYPAIVLSSMNAMRTMRGTAGGLKPKGFKVREGLVVFQFVVSVLLIVGTMTVYNQIEYLRSKDLGMDYQNVVSMRVEGALSTQYEAARNQLLKSSAIENVSKSDAHPLAVAIKIANVRWEGKSQDEDVLFKELHTDENFVETMKISVVAGRFFDATRDEGQLNYVVNEEAVRVLGLENPIGHPFALGYEVDGEGTGTGQIVGVVEDFHSGSLADQRIGPMLIKYESTDANFILARLAEGQIAQGIDELRAINRQFNTDYPFEYRFLDAEYDSMYNGEVVIGILSRGFAIMAIVIACLGLLGLAAFTVQRRIKEVGVRLVLGATKLNIMYLLSRDLLLLVGVSFLLALPAAYFLMESWLTSFAYRTEMSIPSLIFAAGLSLSLAVLTVGFQSYRAAGTKPTSLLRCE